MLSNEDAFLRVQWLRNEKRKLWVKQYPHELPESVLKEYRAKWGNDISDEDLKYGWYALFVSARP